MLTEKQQKQKEELRLKIAFHDTELSKYRDKIKKLNDIEILSERKALIGKCFCISNTAYFKTYCRIDGLEGTEPYGISIDMGRNNLNEIHFDWPILYETILKSKRIRPSRFRKYLEKVRELTYIPELINKNPYKKRKHENFIDKIIKITPIVISILKEDINSRDDDNLLCSLVWKKQGAKDFMNFDSFHKKLITGKFATPESITRSRRRLQEKYPELRGDLYSVRHEQEQLLLKNQIKMDF